MTEQAAATEQKATQGQFAVQRVFIKDVSFESPNTPEVFRQAWKPQINMDLNTRSNKLADDVYEVILTLTVTAKNEDKTAFLAEIQQGGIADPTETPSETPFMMQFLDEDLQRLSIVMSRL